MTGHYCCIELLEQTLFFSLQLKFFNVHLNMYSTKILIFKIISQALVAHSCEPSYLRG
jgi:hypothetical protein